MGKAGLPERAILFCGLLYQDGAVYDQAKPALCEAFGPLLLESPETPWTYSHYYTQELGHPLMRRFVLFQGIVDPGCIWLAKERSNKMELLFSVEGKRLINIDPGYITEAKVVLATTKNYAHRIYLREGIYAEVTLYYKDGAWQSHLFTYADYKDTGTAEFLLQGRKMLMQER